MMSRSKRSAAQKSPITIPEGIKGAQAIASAVFLARKGETKVGIRKVIEATCGYNLRQRFEDIQPSYAFDVTCQGTVPAALITFFASESYEDAVRKAISLGGDADTLACITGAVAEAHYRGIPADIAERTLALLDDRLRGVVMAFRERFNIP